MVGSVNMDLVAYVDTMPQAGQTVTGRTFRTVPGGKGANQAVAAARAGADVSFVGAVGDDVFAAQLRQNLADNGCSTSRLRTVPGSSGIAHIRVSDGGENTIVVVPGANASVGDLDATDTQLLADQDVLLLQLELPMAGVLAAARAGTAAWTVLTPAPVQELPAELLDLVDLLMPNQHEAAAITGERDPRRALPALLRLVPAAVITLGADGALLGRRGAEPQWVPAAASTVVDTTGAGDAFCAAFAVAAAEFPGSPRSPGSPGSSGTRPERDHSAALRFAAAAAGLSVGRPGASTSLPWRSEIDAQV